MSFLVSQLRPSDHPRIRGEHAWVALLKSTQIGSSPHTRGAHPKAIHGLHRQRIIPAYAGSTPTRWRKPDSDADHPRIRGEHPTPSTASRRKRGSSPHTRGALRQIRHRPVAYRIIPAYAGSTIRNAYRLMKLKDHPRIRGEHNPGSRRVQSIPGSSPHTRGAPRQSFRGVERPGIIPAYAGSTPPSCPWSCFGSDHPRIRGEHLRNVIIDAQKAGSSPHTRGAPVPRMPTSASWRDHPRIRGEHRRTPDRRVAPGGSSPHTRGARSRAFPARS